MHASPGGQLDPKDIVGRDLLIARLWRTLETQSVVLSAERRMGKTSIVRKMEAEPPDGVIAIYHDLEPIREPLEFVEVVFHDVERYLSKKNQLASHARRVLAQLQGAEVKGIVKFPNAIAPHWKSLLTGTIEDLVEQQQDADLVFFWDELPLMLYNIKKDHGEAPASELLDTLRALRHTHPALRMVYTGSIGLHHVLTGLRAGGYANDPTNDMYQEDVPPLAPHDARGLAEELIEGERLQCVDKTEVATVIAQQVDNIPFFIHHVVRRLAGQRSVTIDPATVEGVVRNALVDPQNAWHLAYYRERLDQYYAAEIRPIALALLDILAVATTPSAFRQLDNLLQSQMPVHDREEIRAVLALLQRDHYLVQDPSTAGFRFRFPLIQRFWRIYRDLETV